jgi:hypothetical protein
MTIQQTMTTYAVDAAPVLGTLLVAVVTFLAAQATAWMRAHTKNTLVLGFMDRVSEEVEKGVAAIEQTVVAQLKPASGGVLSAEDAARVKQAALDLVLANLGGQKWLDEAKKILGEADIKAFLASRIEAAVQGMQRVTPGATAVAQVVEAARP